MHKKDRRRTERQWHAWQRTRRRRYLAATRATADLITRACRVMAGA